MDWDQWCIDGGLTSARPELAFEIPEEGGMAADSVLHYLSLFVDDIARVIPYVVAYPTEGEDVDGFSRLKTKILQRKIIVSQTLHHLFEELENADSWWHQGYRHSIGIRHRLVHYTDLVYFHGDTKNGDTRMHGYVSLGGVGGPLRHDNFEDALSEILAKLCEWLDHLERPLIDELSEKLLRKGIAWNPLQDVCPTVALPPMLAARHTQHYLYLPVFVDGSNEV